MGFLYLVRHGQSVANAERICSGSIAYNCGLSREGLDQAEQFGRSHPKLALDLMVTSRLKRSKDTATAIRWGMDRPPAMVENSAFDERSLGVVEGRPIAEVQAEYGHRYAEWFNKTNAAPPNGESMFQLYQRVVPFFQDAVEPLLYEGDQHIMIVTHMSVIQILQGYIEQTPLDEFFAYSIDNCSISGYDFESED